MGKEQELIEAARSGNLAVVERYLSQRAKRSGPLASLRRGPGANAQDQSGYTSLHHSALNGHKDIVSLLLQYEASTNVVDHKGSTPLHLAAWTGNTEIVRMLLEQGPSVPNVNLANHDRETPLHSAAQYGHTEVVSLLLKHESDPSVRNLKEESALDLAAQYGRLETVQLLVDTHPTLLKNHVSRHSPLHLASRNGHKNVVKVLLDGGFDVNAVVESGSALHEAALYGKVEVVKQLLDYGIDVNLENNLKRTVFDLLEDLNTAIAKQIARIIREHTTVVSRVDDSSKSLYSASPASSFSSVSTFVPTPEKQGLPLPLVRSSSPMSEATDTLGSYNSSKRSSTASDTLRKSQGSSSEHLSMSSRSPSVYETPSLPKDFDTASVHSAYDSRDLMTSSTDSSCLTTFSPPEASTTASSRTSMPPGWKPQPPAKPPRKSITSLSPSGKAQHHIRHASYEPNQHLYVSSSSAGSGDSSSEAQPRTPPSGFGNSTDNANGLINGPTGQKHPSKLSNGKTPESSPFSALYDDIASGRITSFSGPSMLGGTAQPPGYHRRRLTGEHGVRPHGDQKPIPPAKPKTLDLRTKRATVQIPLSPTHYQQPPTPDFPPPSPSTAVIGIHEKIRPLSQEYRKNRLSRDIETLTEEELFATIDARGNVRVSFRRENKSVSTDTIEEVVDEDPFAGLCRGSIVCPSTCTCDLQMALRSPTKNEPHNYEIVGVGSEPLPGNRNTSRKAPRRENSSSEMKRLSTGETNSEWTDGSTATESVFVRDMEEHFARTLSRLRKEFQRSSFTSSFSTVEEWLTSLDLPQYADKLMENGFDDVDFLGGNVLEDEDLVEMDVSDKEHRQKILESCQSLPAMRPLGEGQSPESVDQWLRSLHLDQYIDTFRRNGYTDMERVKKLWEVELNTVLEISKTGHRKRMLTSLGEKPSSKFFDDLMELDVSKLNWDVSKAGGSLLSTADEPSSSGDESRTVDIMRGDTSVRHLSASSANGTISRMESPPSVGSLRIRPPTQLMGDTSPQQMLHEMPSFLSTQWRHQPDVLVKGSCNYTAKYLGSTLVKELRGMESTRKSIQKLKSSTRDMHKIPNVILSISHTGVKFIDAQAKKLVCEHEVRNIHCACQDADDLNHFAYITKEHQTTNHYCHVFCAQSMDMATEIILTLGQAFEVAYQMAMQNKSGRSSHKSDSNNATTPSSQPDDQKRYVSQITVHLVQKTPEKKNMDTELKVVES